MTGSSDIAQKLAWWRKEAELTQREAAGWLDVSLRTFQQWEQGRQSPRGFAAKSLLAAIEAHRRKYPN